MAKATGLTMGRHEDDAVLKDLWSRRNNLTQAEWTLLYQIVVMALRDFRPQILSSLSEDHDTYIQDFFQDKVFRFDLLSRLDHLGAVRVAYERYLHDRYDRERVRRTEELPEDDEPRETTKSAEVAGTEGNCSVDEDEFKALYEAGISPKSISESAANWLREADPWIPVILALHFCPDRENRQPLQKLARRLRIASYHYKAEKLGITGNFNKDWSAGTLLGHWLSRDIRIEVSRENHQLVLAALKILCFEALTWGEQQEATP